MKVYIDDEAGQWETQEYKEKINNMKEDKTDLQRFIALYKSVGIELEPEDFKDGSSSLVLEAGAHEKIDGYICFFTSIDFDKDGKFIEQRVYE